MRNYREKCDLCSTGSENFKLLFEKFDYHIVKCKNCGLLFTQEIPSKEELKNFYGKSYYEGYIYQSYSSMDEEKKRFYLKNIIYFENFSGEKKGNILEIGSATGIFLSCAGFMGYNATGVEISNYAVDIAKKNNLNIFNKNLDELQKENIFKKDFFDAVFLWDCIEHLSSPSAWLDYINYCTKPGGLVVLNTLNTSSPTVKYLKEKWSQFYPPWHLFYFGLNTLKDIFCKSGFTIIKLKTDGPLFYDDHTGKYFLFGKIFSNRLIQRITNRLKLGYAQFVIAKKTSEV
jgi:2-polyprenyl-3-methyl-5-hydroxy-6-metoxy-1,4-benzoquinol methylase